MITPKICPYCGSKVQFKDSAIVYGRSYGMIYICSDYPSCDAFVGVHKGTRKSLGRLANAELREWKKQAHAMFDPIWKYRHLTKNKSDSRSKAYYWLASEMGLNLESCHIGMFTVEQCKQVVVICQIVYEQYPRIKAYANNGQAA